MNASRIEFDQAFVEEAVCLRVRHLERAQGTAAVLDFHRGKDRLYEIPDKEEKERKFKKFFDEYFRRLGWHEFFCRIARDFLDLADPHLLIFVKKVWNRRHELAQLYVAGDLKTVLLGVDTSRLEDRANLETWIYHELFHVSDMLDPGFVYSPAMDMGGVCPAETELIRDRFRFLWDLFIVCRMRLGGRRTLTSPEKMKEDFERLFRSLDSREREEILSGMTAGKTLTQSDLVRWARAVLERGFRCSLCGFPSPERVDPVCVSEAGVVQRIRRDRPGWTVELGICLRCFEIYQCLQETPRG